MCWTQNRGGARGSQAHEGIERWRSKTSRARGAEVREWIHCHAVQLMRARGTDPTWEGIQRMRRMRMNQGLADTVGAVDLPEKPCIHGDWCANPFSVEWYVYTFFFPWHSPLILSTTASQHLWASRSGRIPFHVFVLVHVWFIFARRN